MNDSIILKNISILLTISFFISVGTSKYLIFLSLLDLVLILSNQLQDLSNQSNLNNTLKTYYLILILKHEHDYLPTIYQQLNML